MNCISISGNEALNTSKHCDILGKQITIIYVDARTFP